MTRAFKIEIKIIVKRPDSTCTIERVIVSNSCDHFATSSSARETLLVVLIDQKFAWPRSAPSYTGTELLRDERRRADKTPIQYSSEERLDESNVSGRIIGVGVSFGTSEFFPGRSSEREKRCCGGGRRGGREDGEAIHPSEPFKIPN